MAEKNGTSLLICYLSTPTSERKPATSKKQNQGRFPPLSPNKYQYGSRRAKPEALSESRMTPEVDGQLLTCFFSAMCCSSRTGYGPSQPETKPNTTGTFPCDTAHSYNCCSLWSSAPYTPPKQHPKASLGLTPSLLREQRGQNLNPSFWLGK